MIRFKTNFGFCEISRNLERQNFDLDRSPGSLGPFWGPLAPPRGPKFGQKLNKEFGALGPRGSPLGATCGDCAGPHRPHRGGGRSTGGRGAAPYLGYPNFSNTRPEISLTRGPLGVPWGLLGTPRPQGREVPWAPGPGGPLGSPGDPKL